MRRLKTARLIPIAVALSLLAACGGQQSAAPAADNAKIAEAVKGQAAGLVAAFNAHDAEKAVSYDAPDYVGMFHGAPNVVGPEADLALTRQQVADPAAKVTVSNEDVSVAEAGDRALWRSTYAYTYTDPKTKQPTTENGNWLIGWRKQADGSWKAAWGVVSDTGPAQAAPDGAEAPA
jgi:ketosteroid isomerase-like protein